MASAPPQNWWDSDPVAQHPSAAPGSYTVGTPHPRQPPPQTAPQALHDEHTARTAGLPTGYEWDPDGRGAHPIRGTPMDPNAGRDTIDPASVTESERRVAQAMIGGRVPPPTGRSLASAQSMRLLAIASQIDPEFDLTTWGRRNAANRAFTSGRQGQNITAFNTAIHHLARFAQDSDALDNWGGETTPAALSHVSNTLRNAMANGNLAGRLTAFNNDADAVAAELTTAFRGTNGAEADVQAWRSNLRPNMTPQEFRAAVQSAIGLLRGRIEAMNSSYRQAMGPNATVEDLIDPHSHDILRRLEGGDLGAALPPPHPNGSPPPPTDGLVVHVTGQGTPAFEAAYAQARQQNPGLTRAQFADQREAEQARQAQAPDTLDRIITGSMGLAIPSVAAPQLLGALGFAPGEGVDALTRGALDVPTIGLRDEIAGSARTLLGSGTRDQNIGRERAIDASDWQNHLFARGAGELAGGFALPMGAEAGLGRQALQSGAMGAAYGFGSGEGNPIERVPNALMGGGIGLAAPYVGWAGGRVANSLAAPLRRGVSVTPEGEELARAAEAEQVPLSRPVVDPSARNRMMALESQVGGHGPVRESLNATAAGIENAVGRLAGPGTANERGAMGSRIQEAAQNYVQQSGRRIGAIYRRAADLAGDAPIIPINAVHRLDGHIAQLEENAAQNAPVIKYLRNVRSDLLDETGAHRAKTVQSIRDMRTNLRGNIDQAGLTHTNAERIMSDVLDGASDDINVFLGSTNPEANRLYQQADKAWRARHQEITQVVDRLVGRADNPAGGGQVMTSVTGLMSGDVPRLRRVLAMLSPAERADLRATVAARAGYRSPDEPFSLPQFIAWQRSIPDSARRAVFGEEGARSIQNLTALSRALIDTRGALNNTRSGAARNAAAFWQSLLSGFVPGGAAGLMAGGDVTGTALGVGAASAALAGATAAVRRMSAKALMNPDMSRWLAQAVRAQSPQAIRSHIGRLATVAANDPAIAQEVLGLRQRLLSAMNDNSLGPRQAAASSGQGADSNQQGQQEPNP